MQIYADDENKIGVQNNKTTTKKRSGTLKQITKFDRVYNHLDSFQTVSMHCSTSEADYGHIPTSKPSSKSSKPEDRYATRGPSGA